MEPWMLAIIFKPLGTFLLFACVIALLLWLGSSKPKLRSGVKDELLAIRDKRQIDIPRSTGRDGTGGPSDGGGWTPPPAPKVPPSAPNPIPHHPKTPKPKIDAEAEVE